MSTGKPSLKERFVSLFRVNDEEQQDIHYEGNPMKRLLKYMKPYRRTFVICLALVLALTGLELVKPIIIGDAIDQYITGEKSEVLLAEGREQWEAGEQAEERYSGVLKAGALYLGVLLLLFAFNRMQTLMLQKMGQDIIYDIRNELFTHVEKLTMRFFDTTPVGKIVTRLTNDVEAINEVFSNILVKLFRNVVKMIGLAVIMISMNPRMALYSFILVPVMAVITLVFRLNGQTTTQTKQSLTLCLIIGKTFADFFYGINLSCCFHGLLFFADEYAFIYTLPVDNCLRNFAIRFP